MLELELLSSPAPLTCGVPHGSILGPLHFYVALKQENTYSASQLLECINDASVKVELTKTVFI